jgi:uncharacterized membrane protein HdeD (DUF308 family)
MVALVKLVGIIMVSAGAAYLVKPSIIKQFVNFWEKDTRIYLAGVLNIIFGIIFLRAAARCALSWFVVLIGLLSLAKGITAFVLGPKKTIGWLKKFLNKPVQTLRTFGILALITGIVLIYAS